MAAGCPAKCAKFLLIVFNIIFWLSGAALLAVGIWLLVDSSILDKINIIYVDSSDQWFKYAAYVLIAVGAFAFLTGFAGCCGAIRESPCLLGTYIFLLVIVMLVEITAGVLAFVFRNQIEQQVEIELSKTLQSSNYTSEVNSDGDIIYSGFGSGMNLFQQEIECCGVNGTDDYKVLKDKKVFDDEIPYACCVLTNPDSRPSPQKDDLKEPPCTKDNAFKQGCGQGIKDYLRKYAVILIGLGIGIACLEIFGIIFAVCLCRNPSTDKYE